MARSIHIIKTGLGSNGRPFARGVVDYLPEEQLAALSLASSNGNINPPPAAFGPVNGLSDPAVAALSPGDNITAETLAVRARVSSFVDAVTGEARKGIDHTLVVSGKCSREAAATADSDWA